MVCIRASLTPSDGIRLIKSSIIDTAVQKDLIVWNHKYSHIRHNVDQVGAGYRQGFMRRNKHLIVSRKGQKYELNRSNWTTYKNFAQMYESIEEELIAAGVATLLDELVWISTNGDVVKEKDEYGCKVTIDITKPEMCVVADEVGGNMSQKGDGLVGGELMLIKPGQVAQRNISTKDKHYTLLGLILLTGEPLICVVIMAGDNPKPEVETGIDFFAEQIGASTDRDYIINNTGKGVSFQVEQHVS